MYNLEYSEQSLTTDDNVCLMCDLSGTNGRLKRGKLFRLIRSLTDCDWVRRRSLTNVSYYFCPVSSRCFIVLITAVSARSLVSRTRRSLLSSRNGFPISSITLNTDSHYL